MLHFLVCQFAESFNAFLSKKNQCNKTTPQFVREVFAIPGAFSVAPAEIRDSNIRVCFSMIV